MNDSLQSDNPRSGLPPFVSKLAEARQRFLAHAIEHAFAIRRRTASDFLRHFPPAAIMDGLRSQPRLRAGILVLATGVKERVAIKKSAASAAEDLQIALDEGETDPDSVVMLFNPDDRVRFLDAKLLWQFLIEGEFWTISPGKKEDFERAKEHIAFLLERALADKLVSHRDVVAGISVEELVTRLPKAELGKIIGRALASSQTNAPFREEDLLSAAPPSMLVRFVPLPHIWRMVIEPRIARAHGYADTRADPVVDPGSWETPAGAVPPASSGTIVERAVAEGVSSDAPRTAELGN